MLILDSNILYYLNNLSQVPNRIDKTKLQAIIQECENEVVISSVSWWEILLHYRKNPEIICCISAFMRCNNIHIYNDNYISAPTADFDFTQITQQDLDKYIDQNISTKIDVESRFACVVYLLIILAIAFFEVTNIITSADNKIVDLISVVFATNMKFSIDFFKEKYIEGYKTDDCKEFIRKFFQEYLSITIPITVSLCKKIDGATQKQLIDLCDLYSKQINKVVRKKNSVTAYISKQARNYGKKIDDKQLTIFFDEIWKVIIRSNIQYDSLKKYIFLISKKIILNGSPFIKNDINDALILGSVKNNDLILTLDSKMIEYMVINKQGHSGYEQSLKLLSQLLKSEIDGE